MSKRSVRTFRCLYAYQFVVDPEQGVKLDSEWVVSDQYFESDEHFESVMLKGRTKLRYRRLDWSEMTTYEITSWNGALV